MSRLSRDHADHVIRLPAPAHTGPVAFPPASAVMASSLGGMFTGQLPGPPPPPPGLPGQASLLQATPGAPRPSNSTLVDELESSFEVSRDVGVFVQPSLACGRPRRLTSFSVPAPSGCGGPEDGSRLL